jgi:hypothetical protein
MSTPVRPLPTPNRILAAGWIEAEQARHQDRLRSMRPLVDSGAPKSAQVKIKRAKQRMQLEAEHERIDRENRILLQRMSAIHSKPSPAMPTPTAPTPAQALAQARARSLNSAVRAREQERIAEENLALVERLKRGKGYQEQLALERHAQEYEVLRENGSRARLPPAAIPAPKIGSGHSPSSSLLGDRFAELSMRPGERLIAKHNRALGLSASPSTGSIKGSSAAASPTKGSVNAAASRPVEETHDARGPVEPISASSYPSLTPRSAAASSQHTVQVAQDNGARIDGRSVMLTLDEMRVPPQPEAATAEEDSAAAAASEESGSSSVRDPALQHAFLFRTFEEATGVHQYVAVPYAVVAALPECTANEGALLHEDQRAQLAEALFARLRFVGGGGEDSAEAKLAFNPSHALRPKHSRSAQRSAPKKGANTAAAGKRKPGAASPSKKKAPATGASPALSAIGGGSGTPGKSTWDAIGADGKLHPTADEVEWERAINGTPAGSRAATATAGGADSDSSATPSGTPLVAKGAKKVGSGSGGGGGGARVGTHHMSTTLATVLRAGQGAPDAVHTIQLARANRERQANFKAHVQPVPPMERDRSKSPNRGARSPTRPTAAAPATAATPSTPGSKKVSAPNSPLVSSSAATVADARAVVKQAKLRAAASDAAADVAAADLAATMATNNNTPPQPEEKEQS